MTTPQIPSDTINKLYSRIHEIANDDRGWEEIEPTFHKKSDWQEVGREIEAIWKEHARLADQMEDGRIPFDYEMLNQLALEAELLEAKKQHLYDLEQKQYEAASQNGYSPRLHKAIGSHRDCTECQEPVDEHGDCGCLVVV